jgi:hypothetical protein
MKGGSIPGEGGEFPFSAASKSATDYAQPAVYCVRYQPISLLPITFIVFEKLFLKRTKQQPNTQSSVWLQTEAFRNRTDTTDCVKDKRSSRKQTALLSSIPRHLTSIPQSMAYRTTAQAKTELFANPKILPAQQIIPR